MGAALPELVARHDGVVVVDKPAGLASTGRTLQDPDCVQWQLMARLRRSKVWAVHQLDKLTSGLNVFVLKKALVAEWAERLRFPQATKTYLAIAAGPWPEDEALRASLGVVAKASTAASASSHCAVHVDLPIGRVTRGGKTFASITRAGKPAYSVVRRLASSGRATAVEVELRTGRTHQVRLHLASIGLPIIGDPLHGVALEGVAADGMALHAWRLDIRDAPPPLCRLEAPIPPRLRRTAEHLGLSF